MMNDNKYPNSGTLWTNDYKTQPHQPDYKGKGEYNGVEFELAAWVKTDRNGKQFLSLKISEPYRKEAP